MSMGNAPIDKKALTLLGLRLSLALLMIVWGADKLVNPGHGAAVADRFYGGILSSQAVMPALGSLQILLGLGVALGLLRRYTYPILAVVTGVTLIGVWRSILDPWGWYLENTNALFFPSLTIFLAALVLIAHKEEDTLRLGAGTRTTGIEA